MPPPPPLGRPLLPLREREIRWSSDFLRAFAHMDFTHPLLSLGISHPLKFAFYYSIALFHEYSATEGAMISGEIPRRVNVRLSEGPSRFARSFDHEKNAVQGSILGFYLLRTERGVGRGELALAAQVTRTGGVSFEEFRALGDTSRFFVCTVRSSRKTSLIVFPSLLTAQRSSKPLEYELLRRRLKLTFSPPRFPPTAPLDRARPFSLSTQIASIQHFRERERDPLKTGEAILSVLLGSTLNTPRFPFLFPSPLPIQTRRSPRAEEIERGTKKGRNRRANDDEALFSWCKLLCLFKFQFFKTYW